MAWHKDFLKEQTQNVGLATDDSLKGKAPKQSGQTRYTTEFRIYKLDEFLEYKKMINKAFETGCLDHTVWE